ncbi:MAG: hypothetical protein MK226_14475 [Saprospiraceae bacterium]|nr:hypothetical protein [Saprospiraceae bacterium]
MKRFYFSLILLSLLFMACQKKSQEVIEEPTPEMPALSGPQWNLLEDASHLAKAYSSIVRLNIDHQDQLWIGSDYRGDDGLWRKGLWNFNGSTWQFIQQIEEHFPHASFIEKIAFDHNNQLWFGMDHELVQFDGSQLNRHHLPVNLENGKLQVLKRTADGSLWMSIYNHLLRHHDGTWENYELPQEVVDIHAFEVSLNGIWLGTNSGVFLLENGMVDSVNEGVNSEGELITIEEVQDIVYLEEKGTFFATSTGLIQQKDGIWQKWNSNNSLLATDAIHSLAIDQDQELWIGNQDGLYHFALEDAQLTFFEPPIIEHCIACKPKALDIAVDSENRKWLLSDDNMIFILEIF